MTSLSWVWSSRTQGIAPVAPLVVEGGGIALGSLDAEAEQIADSTDVAAGGVDLLEDAVLSQCLGSEIRVGPRELAADRDEAWRAAAGDQQVRVDTAGPGACTVVQPCGEADAH